MAYGGGTEKRQRFSKREMQNAIETIRSTKKIVPENRLNKKNV
jgi:hypothetical protein